MDVLLRYGSGRQIYTFEPERQISLRDNFRNVVPRTSRLPGVSGGFDELGLNAGPTEVGVVQTFFWVHADSAEEMERSLQSVAAMASWGVKRLFKQPVDPAEGPRYCDARVSSVEWSSNASDQPHKRQRVQINYQVANPVWLGRGTESVAWGEGVLWGSGAAWGGGAPSFAVSGIQNDFSFSVGGNATTYPRLEILSGGLTDIRVQRLVEGVVVDEVRYATVIPDGQRLVVNARSLAVTLDGADAYGAHFSAQNAGWFRLEAGLNDVRVLMANPGDNCTIYFRYFEAYR